MISRFPIVENGVRVWVEKLSMATDDSTHFPIVGQQFVDARSCAQRESRQRRCTAVLDPRLVDFAEGYFREQSAHMPLKRC